MNTFTHRASRRWLGLLLALAACTPVGAIVITPAQPGANTRYDAVEDYLFGGAQWQTRLAPAGVTLLPRGGTTGLINLLAPFTRAVGDGGGGWTFQSAAEDLKGAFDIDVYDAFSPTTRPGEVGATFVMDYETAPGDPVGVVFHWIQRVVNNHALSGAHGTPDDVIDATRTSALTDPGRLFYDFDVNFADPPHFEDAPFRTDVGNQHDWYAELYLVSIPVVGSKVVTIYNGVGWGWINVPEPATLVLVVLAIALVAPGAARRAAAAG